MFDYCQNQKDIVVVILIEISKTTKPKKAIPRRFTSVDS